jgi:hypothetical protein
MPESFGARLKHAWNAFMNRDPTNQYDFGQSYATRPDRARLYRSGAEKTIVNAIINRIAVDTAGITIQHVRLDENNRYIETIYSGLNDCLTTRANIDQTGRSFIQDLVTSMCDEGSVAVVPIDTIGALKPGGGYSIKSLRVGKIVSWYPQHVRIQIYNDQTGRKEEITLPKLSVAIIENPFYSVMNEPNSTARRLIHKLSLLDITDEQTASGKLDLIIQFPYLIRSDIKRAEANRRRKELEDQLSGSKYGVAYTDSTEKVTQLNRSVENNLMSQIEYLTTTLYSQLGITKSILEGTASEEELTSYYTRTIEPIMSAIALEFTTKFLSKTAQTQRQTIMYYQDPFKFTPSLKLADLADKLTRNEIMTSNEFRQIIGLKAINDPRADELINKNMPVQDEGVPEEYYPESTEAEKTGQSSGGITVDDVRQMFEN